MQPWRPRIWKNYDLLHTFFTTRRFFFHKIISMLSYFMLFFMYLKRQNQMVKKVTHHAELWGKILKCQVFVTMCVICIQIHEEYVCYHILHMQTKCVSVCLDTTIDADMYEYNNWNLWNHFRLSPLMGRIFWIVSRYMAELRSSPALWEKNLYCASHFCWVSGVLLDTFSILFVKYGGSIPVKKYSIKYRIINFIPFWLGR